MSPAQAETQKCSSARPSGACHQGQTTCCAFTTFAAVTAQAIVSQGMPATAQRRRGVNAGVFLISRSPLCWRANINFADMSSRPTAFTSSRRASRRWRTSRTGAESKRAPDRQGAIGNPGPGRALLRRPATSRRIARLCQSDCVAGPSWPGLMKGGDTSSLTGTSSRSVLRQENGPASKRAAVNRSHRASQARCGALNVLGRH
jgi:hypothetical protein